MMSSRASDEASERTLQGQWHDQEKPFLESEWINSSDSREDMQDPPLLGERKRRCGRMRMLLPHIVMVIAYTVATLFVWRAIAEKYSHGPNIVWTPAREALQYEEHYFHDQDNWDHKYFPMNPKPDDGLDDVWREHIAPANVLFTKEEVDRFGGASDRSVILPNGTYYGSTTVYHNLHCLHYLYKSIWRDTYFPELTHKEETLLQMHNMHCLSYVKQTLTCNPDMTPMIMYWPKNISTPTTQLDYPHECANWDSLDGWARSRMFNPFAKGLLIHPDFNVQFQDSPGPHVGAVVIGNDETVHVHGDEKRR